MVRKITVVGVAGLLIGAAILLLAGPVVFIPIAVTFGISAILLATENLSAEIFSYMNGTVLVITGLLLSGVNATAFKEALFLIGLGVLLLLYPRYLPRPQLIMLVGVGLVLLGSWNVLTQQLVGVVSIFVGVVIVGTGARMRRAAPDSSTP